MDAGKVKIVLNALRQELHARRLAAQGTAGAADDAAVLPTSAVTGAHLNREDANAQDQRRRAHRMPAAAESGVLVHLSGDALAAADSSRALHSPRASAYEQLVDRPIPDVVVPFRLSDEPLVPVAPYVIIAAIAAASVLALMLAVL